MRVSRSHDPLASIWAKVSSPPLTSGPVLEMSIAVSDLERPTLAVGVLNRSENLHRAQLCPVHARRYPPTLGLGSQKAPNVAFHAFKIAPLSAVELMDDDSLCFGEQCRENRLARLLRYARRCAEVTPEVNLIRGGGSRIVEDVDAVSAQASDRGANTEAERESQSPQHRTDLALAHAHITDQRPAGRRTATFRITRTRLPPGPLQRLAIPPRLNRGAPPRLRRCRSFSSASSHRMRAWRRRDRDRLSRWSERSA